LAYARRVPAANEPLWLSKLLRPITEVRQGEATTALLLTTNVFLLLTAYYLIKPVREALILALEAGAEYKSYMSGVIAVLLLVLVPLYAKVADRLPRGKLVSGVTLFFASHLAIFFAFSMSSDLRGNIGLFFYVWVGIFNMMVVAQFWSFANDLYDEEQGKRLFPLIAVGASVGAALGSKIAAGLIPIFGVFPMLLVAGGILLLSGFLFVIVDRREQERDRPSKIPSVPAVSADGERGHGAFQMVMRHRYLLLIAAFSLIFSWVNSNGEYLLGKLVKAAALEAVAKKQITPAGVGDYIGATYGEFFFYVNVIGVFLQSFVVSRLVRWIGPRPAFFILPAIAFGNAAAVAVAPVLAVLRVGKIAENSTDYSLNNTLRQMLWLVTSREMKYKAKQAVDTFFVRIGDVSSALLVWVGSVILQLSVQQFSAVNAGLVLIWLLLAYAIVREQRRLEAHPVPSGPTAAVEAAG
jgi:AAA family ATP:ADP antiporter